MTRILDHSGKGMRAPEKTGRTACRGGLRGGRLKDHLEVMHMADLNKSNVTPAARVEAGSKDVHRIFTVSFIIFLIIAVVARVLPRRWRPWPAKPEGYRSVIDEARAVANTFVPFAFMG